MTKIDDFINEIKAYDCDWFDEIGGNEAIRQLATLRTQQAELVKALEDAEKALALTDVPRSKAAVYRNIDALAKIRIALAKVKGDEK